jgi:hypothetical protein
MPALARLYSLPESELHLSSKDWLEKTYNDTLEAVLAGLQGRRRVDPSFGVGDAEGTLAHLYVQEGNDWGGRGMLQDEVLAATIAAHEQFIEAWKREGAPGLPEEKA